MNNIQNQFDETFVDRGGIFPLDNVPFIDFFRNNMQDYVELLVKEHPNCPDVYMDVINTYHVNACATKNYNVYFIGINVGAIAMIYVTFLRMASSPTVLTDFGDISKEREIEKVHNAQFENFGHYASVNGPDVWVFPNADERYDLAVLLTLHALAFVVSHEFGHIINGHLDYIESVSGSLLINEYQIFSEEDSVIDGLISQSLQADADAFAINRIVRHVWNSYHNANDNNLPKSLYHSFYEDYLNSLYLNCFAIYTFFRLFGMRTPELDKLKTYSHPPAPIRQRILFATIATIFEDEDQNFLDNLRSTFMKVIGDVEVAFTEISEQELDLKQLKFADAPEAQAHLLFFVEHWKIVRPLLEPYAYKKLAK